MKKRAYIIPALCLLCIVALLLVKPIPQDLRYHFFAGQRKIFGNQNFQNVITNVPFFIIGLMGLREGLNIKEKKIMHITVTLFTGFLLLFFRSACYHWYPNNTNLIYDRVLMVIIFMSFFALIIHDRINAGIGYNASLILNAIGVMSVIYWALTERAGSGDVRRYGMVQFFPIIAIPLILFLYKSTFNHWKEVVPIFIFFALAKLAEQFDKRVYDIRSAKLLADIL